MLIQISAPRLRPAGGPVFRVRRSHPLAAELRICLLTGGSQGLGIDLVSGLALAGVSVPSLSASEDGPAIDIPLNSYATLPYFSERNIVGPVSIAVRANTRVTNGMFLTSAPVSGGGASNTPWSFWEYSSSLCIIRSNTHYCLWKSNSANVTFGTTRTYAVSSSDIGGTPTFYFDGVSDSASVLYSNGGSGTAGTNTEDTIVGKASTSDSYYDGQLNLALVAARIWSADEHAGFHADPYRLIEDAPLYHFLTPEPTADTISGTLSATLAAVTLSSAGTLALRGTTTATLGAATLASTGAVALTGTSTATLAAATMSATGTLAISGTATATLAAITGVAAGTVALTGALAVTLDAATLAADGTSASVVTGTLAVTLDAATLAAASTLVLRGTTTTTLANATLAGTGTLSLRATSSVTLGNVALSATGTNGSVVNAIVLVWNGVRI